MNLPSRSRLDLRRVKVFWVFALSLNAFAFAMDMPKDYEACIKRNAPVRESILAPDDSLVAVEPVDLPKFETARGDLKDFKLALERQLDACKRQDLTTLFQIGKRLVSRHEWCIMTNEKLLSFIAAGKSFSEVMENAKTEFSWFKILSAKDAGIMVSAYNTPGIEISLKRTKVFKYPIYKTPKDLISVVDSGVKVWRRKTSEGLVPYYDRAEIEGKGVLKSKGLEIAYAKSLLDLYILQIEGSGIGYVNAAGKLKRKVMLNFDSHNGLESVGLVPLLKCFNLPDSELTIPGLRKFFAENPALLGPALKVDRRYTFFRMQESPPMSAVNIPLTPMVSVAVNRKAIPIGVPIIIQTKVPEADGGVITWKDHLSMAIAQDTGDTEMNPGRVDLYAGEGPKSELTAGIMMQPGSFFIAIPKEIPNDAGGAERPSD